MGLWNVQKLKAILPRPEPLTVTAQVCRNVNWYCSYTENELLTIHQKNHSNPQMSLNHPSSVGTSHLHVFMKTPIPYCQGTSRMNTGVLSNRLFLRDRNRCGNATEETLRKITKSRHSQGDHKSQV